MGCCHELTGLPSVRLTFRISYPYLLALWYNNSPVLCTIDRTTGVFSGNSQFMRSKSEACCLTTKVWRSASRVLDNASVSPSPTTRRWPCSRWSSDPRNICWEYLGWILDTLIESATGIEPRVGLRSDAIPPKQFRQSFECGGSPRSWRRSLGVQDLCAVSRRNSRTSALMGWSIPTT